MMAKIDGRRHFKFRILPNPPALNPNMILTIIFFSACNAKNILYLGIETDATAPILVINSYQKPPELGFKQIVTKKV